MIQLIFKEESITIIQKNSRAWKGKHPNNFYKAWLILLSSTHKCSAHTHSKKLNSLRNIDAKILNKILENVAMEIVHHDKEKYILVSVRMV